MREYYFRINLREARARGLLAFDILQDYIVNSDVFPEWHNDRYLWQCYYNLQEKYDCGGITQNEWDAIDLFFKSRYPILQEEF